MNIKLIHESFELRKPVATVGIFDGVHTGHRFMLEQLKSRAHDHGGESVVITLWPHPRLVLNQDIQDFKLLHTREEKIRELTACGIDYLVLVPFNKEMASYTACDFVSNILVEKLGIEVLMLGYDNRLGRDRISDPERLARCAGGAKIRIEKLPEYPSELGRVSSTGIREAILRGELESAAGMLGYPYYLVGTIVEGSRVGRELGFPTANVHPVEPYKLIPMNGVYAVRCELKGKTHDGMLNIGFRPTLDSGSAVKTIEAHLFEAGGDFYGEHLVIHFISRIRDEMKFKGLEELKKQLKQDEITVRRILSGKGS